MAHRKVSKEFQACSALHLSTCNSYGWSVTRCNSVVTFCGLIWAHFTVFYNKKCPKHGRKVTTKLQPVTGWSKKLQVLRYTNKYAFGCVWDVLVGFSLSCAHISHTVVCNFDSALYKSPTDGQTKTGPIFLESGYKNESR